ncbi:MAG: hypothetical protein IJS39_07055 [Synergistaceae bacterium]|nr:hypothetical protein [Synergistaceae bacterium]
MLNDRVLFWPGRGKPKNVLSDFLAGLGRTYEVYIFPFEYDSGEKPFCRDSSWCRWLQEHNFSWWCGLSLGASFACVMSSLCPPERLTLINPFSSRKILAQEKGFTLGTQWDFSPADFCPEVREAEIAVSVHDEKIPVWHGLHLLNKIRAGHKRLILVDGNHCIDDHEAQTELADILTGDIDGETKHCYVYQRQ